MPTEPGTGCRDVDKEVDEDVDNDVDKEVDQKARGDVGPEVVLDPRPSVR
ncbi:hypothetical protein [Sinomonas notoginsengisoli]|nr:hypothetical protein [Sinomonas notoginsengisoli]